MSNRHLILSALLLLFLVAFYWFRQDAYHSLEPVAARQTLWRELEPDQVREIRAYLGSEAGKLVLRKEGDSWNIASYFGAPADGAKVRFFLNSLAEMKGDLRAEQRDLFPTFRLEEGKALVVEVRRGERSQKVDTLLVGKKAPEGVGCFVRFKGHTQVFLADQNLLVPFGFYGGAIKTPEPTSWVDLDLVHPDRDSWARVELVQPKESMVLEKTASDEKGGSRPSSWVWKSGGTEPAAEADVETVVMNLERLRALRILEPSQTDGNGDGGPTHGIRITLDNGEVLQYLLTPPEKGRGARVTTPGGHVYEISEKSFAEIYSPEDAE